MRRKIAALPADLKRDPKLIADSKQALVNRGKDGIWQFWDEYFRQGQPNWIEDYAKAKADLAAESDRNRCSVRDESDQIHVPAAATKRVSQPKLTEIVGWT